MKRKRKEKYKNKEEKEEEEDEAPNHDIYWWFKTMNKVLIYSSTFFYQENNYKSLNQLN